MEEAVIVFVSQFVFIMLKGRQQMHVVKGRTMAAAAVSFALGVCGLATLGVLTNALTRGASWLVYAAFLAGGPVGIVTAIGMEKWKRNFTS